MPFPGSPLDRLNNWRQRGRVCLWRRAGNTRNFPGVDCTGDAEGCLSLCELFSLFLECDRPASRSIVVTRPSEQIAATPGILGRWSSPARWRITSAMALEQPNVWRWEGDLQSPTLVVGRTKLEKLTWAFRRIGESADFWAGDFCVHGDETRLHGFEFEHMAIWFWQRLPDEPPASPARKK